MAIQHTLLPYYLSEETLIGFVVNWVKKANKKFQLTAGSAVFFQGHFLSKLSVLVKFTVYLPASSELGVINSLHYQSGFDIHRN
jgi:hypothetical protein